MQNCDNCSKKKALEIIKKYKGRAKDTINCLQEVQSVFGYLPEELFDEMSMTLGVSVSELYGIVTFYTQFRLTPKSQYNIDVCLGTACFINGGDKIVEEFERSLNIKMGEKTPDNKFALTNTRCVGCCGLAPVVSINGEVYGKVKREQVKEILSNLK